MPATAIIQDVLLLGHTGRKKGGEVLGLVRHVLLHLLIYQIYKQQLQIINQT